MDLPKLPAKGSMASVAMMTGLGSAIGFLQAHLGDHLPTSSAQWESVGIGAVLAFMASVLHLYQDNPNGG